MLKTCWKFNGKKTELKPQTLYKEGRHSNGYKFILSGLLKEVKSVMGEEVGNAKSLGW
jgi:hypothetical protein